MVGIFIFPVKPTDVEYSYYKTPRKALEISDDDVLSFRNTSKGVYYRIRHDHEWDKLTDNEVVDKWNEGTTLLKIELPSRKSGLGYTTIDKNYLIRIVRK